jgi:hypothetical protein
MRLIRGLLFFIEQWGVIITDGHQIDALISGMTDTTHAQGLIYTRAT